MHILFVADGDSRYGAQNSLLGLVKSLKLLDASLKISVVLTKSHSIGADFRAAGADVYRAPYTPFYEGVSYVKAKLLVKYPVKGLRYLYGRLFALHSLEKQLDLRTVDIVHSNSTREDFGGRIAAKYHKPLVWHIREFGDLDYRCYSYRRDYIGYMKRHASVFIAVSEAVRQHWIKKGIPAEKIRLVYNGVRELPMPDRAGRETRNRPLRLVMLGSVSETKGQHQIIRAIALLPQELRERVTLDIVGDGARTYMNVLRHLTKALHLERNVRFLGYRKGYGAFLEQYDMGVMCSKSEGFGRVTAEYMMAGLPVLASDTGANPELIRDGVTGYLYHYPDAVDLKDRLADILEHTEALPRLGAAAAQAAREKFTEQRNAGEVLKIYGEFEESGK